MRIMEFNRKNIQCFIQRTLPVFEQTFECKVSDVSDILFKIEFMLNVEEDTNTYSFKFDCDFTQFTVGLSSFSSNIDDSLKKELLVFFKEQCEAAHLDCFFQKENNYWTYLLEDYEPLGEKAKQVATLIKEMNISPQHDRCRFLQLEIWEENRLEVVPYLADTQPKVLFYQRPYHLSTSRFSYDREYVYASVTSIEEYTAFMRELDQLIDTKHSILRELYDHVVSFDPLACKQNFLFTFYSHEFQLQLSITPWNDFELYIDDILRLTFSLKQAPQVIELIKQELAILYEKASLISESVEKIQALGYNVECTHHSYNVLFDFSIWDTHFSVALAPEYRITKNDTITLSCEYHLILDRTRFEDKELLPLLHEMETYLTTYYHTNRVKRLVSNLD